MKKISLGTIFSTLLSIMLVCTLLNCAKIDQTVEPEEIDSPTGSSQTVEELAGFGTFCATDNSVSGTRAYIHSITLSSDGTYSYGLYFSDSRSCATAQASGGFNYATYTQTGTFAVSGTAATSGDSTKIIFTVNSGTMIIRGSTSSTLARDFTDWVNSACTPSPAFTVSADTTRSFLGNTCVTSGSFTAVTLPAASENLFNTVYNSGPTLDAGISAGQDMWRPGGSTFPTSYGESYIGW